MIYLTVPALYLIITTGMIWLQNRRGMGMGWRIALLIFLLVFGVAYIAIGVIAPPEPRGVLFRVGAGILTVIPISVGYIIYKNTRGW